MFCSVLFRLALPCLGLFFVAISLLLVVLSCFSIAVSLLSVVFVCSLRSLSRCLVNEYILLDGSQSRLRSHVIQYDGDEYVSLGNTPPSIWAMIIHAVTYPPEQFETGPTSIPQIGHLYGIHFLFIPCLYLPVPLPVLINCLSSSP